MRRSRDAGAPGGVSSSVLSVKSVVNVLRLFRILLVASRSAAGLGFRFTFGLSALALAAVALKSPAQPYIPGQTYFGRSNYIEYIAGNLPFILSAPHGGTLTPSEMPNRTNCASCGWDFATATDSNTDDVAARVKTEVSKLTGHIPHIIICHLDRDKIDCNRAVGEGAQGDPETVIAWTEFQNFINVASNNVITNFGKGFYIDQHGQSHPENRLELGYLLSKYDLTNTDTRLDTNSSFKNSSSIRTLANQVPITFSALLRGTNSFGSLISDEGYPSTPSPDMPYPFANPSSSTSFFDGGYNTAIHGSDNSGPLNALQIEANYDGVRDTSNNRAAYTQALARVLERIFALHYGISLRGCVPKVWDSGSGSWGTASNWADDVVPASSNHLVFAGSGGAVSHNLATLNSPTGVVASVTFSNTASGAYSFSGNNIFVIGGITNNSAFAHTINNNLTLLSNITVSSVANDLTFSGSISNSGKLLGFTGTSNVSVSAVISGGGGLRKTGSGTLALTAVNTYTGPSTNGGGTISVNATSTFGDPNALLVWAGGNILCLNTRSVTPISNSILMSADTVISGNGALANSTRILPFSSSAISTSGGTLTVRNECPNPGATNNIFRVRLTGGGFNFSRPIVIGHPNDLSTAISQLESFNDNSAGDQTYSGVISGLGQLRRDASNTITAGRTVLTAANTFSGGTIVNAGTLVVNNASGSGTGIGDVTVGVNGSLTGTGAISGPISVTGLVSPGQSAGTLTAGNGLDLSSGGTFFWELASNSTNDGNFDVISLTGGNLVLGGTSKLSINFTGSATAPATNSPFWQSAHSWKIIALSGPATNAGQTKFATLLNAAYAMGTFTNTTDVTGNVILTYTPVAGPSPLISPTIVNAGGANATISWNSVNGRVYQVLYKDELSATSWNILGSLIASGPTASWVDTNAPASQRFYRIAVP